MSFFRSTPSYLESVGEKLASEKGLSFDEAIRITENLTFDEILNLSPDMQPDMQACSDRNTTVWLAALEIFISVAGLVLNGIAIFVIIMLKDYQKSISHWYVLQLAFADALFLAMLPLRAHEHLVGSWKLSEWLCRLFQGVFMLNYYAGISFLTIMSFDRYVAIVHPVSALWRRVRTHGNAVIVTMVVWIISALLSLPLWFWSKVNCNCGYFFPSSKEEFNSLHDTSTNETENATDEVYSFLENNPNFLELPFSGSGIDPPLGQHTACHNLPYKSFTVWLLLNFIITFAIPVIMMSVCYSLILWRVLHPAINSANRRTGRRKPSDSNPRPKRNSLLNSYRSSSSSNSSSSKSFGNSKQKHKVTAIVVCLVIFFMICWCPFHLVNLIKFKGLQYHPEKCTIISDITNLLAYANSMLNPIFYTFLGSKFCNRLSSAAGAMRRKRKSSGFSYMRSARNRCAPTYGRSTAAMPASQNKATEASSSGHVNTVQSTVSKIYHPPQDTHFERSRLISSALNSDCSNAHVDIQLKPM